MIRYPTTMDDETSIIQQMRYGDSHTSSQQDSRTLRRFIYLMTIILTLYSFSSYADEMVAMTELREIKGAGWECDNCGMFSAPQSNKCVYCGCKRKK